MNVDYLTEGPAMPMPTRPPVDPRSVPPQPTRAPIPNQAAAPSQQQPTVPTQNTHQAPVQQQVERPAPTLRDHVEMCVKRYFAGLDGQTPTNVYDMVLAEVEAPLLEAIMQYTRGNQTKASIMLGLNRGTLRKKLKTYGML